MLAVEMGDWEGARGKIAEAKEMLARSGLDTGKPASQMSPDADSSRRVQHLSGMVRSTRAFCCCCNLAASEHKKTTHAS